MDDAAWEVEDIEFSDEDPEPSTVPASRPSLHRVPSQKRNYTATSEELFAGLDDLKLDPELNDLLAVPDSGTQTLAEARRSARVRAGSYAKGMSRLSTYGSVVRGSFSAVPEEAESESATGAAATASSSGLAGSAAVANGVSGDLVYEDMIKMDELSVESILLNLKRRFMDDQIYTYVGNILIAVNPYKLLDIYTPTAMRQYNESRVIGELPPHIFALAEDAYSRMLVDGVTPAFIIAGESGAGKTETTKLILQYLAARCAHSSYETVQSQIMESIPVLESFGNAKTVRNNNSSRFGKYLELHFNASGEVVGVQMRTYLLEKSRVVRQAQGERNYHVFYELLRGAPVRIKRQLGLAHTGMEPSFFHYLNQSGCDSIDGVDDKQEFLELVQSMSALGSAPETQFRVWQVVAAVLHVGNITFVHSQKKKHTVIRRAGADAKYEPLRAAARLLDVDARMLEQAITKRLISTGKESVWSPLTVEQAEDTRDVLARALYESLFEWLVHTLNGVTAPHSGAGIDYTNNARHVGILDIFGFERFEANSFEQLTINYTNERLHSLFNRHIFKLEQAALRAEGVQHVDVAFTDNEECVALIEGRPHGLLATLDEECQVPKGSDESFHKKILHKFAKHAHFSAARVGKGTVRQQKLTFNVLHYAGEVNYGVTGMLSKNKDEVPVAVEELLSKRSNSKFLALLQRSLDDSRAVRVQQTMRGTATLSTTGDGGGGARPGAARPSARRRETAGARFRTQLSQLMQSLENTKPYFVRALKPNDEQVPDVIDDEVLETQLRYTGVLETLDVRKKGYPHRYTFDECLVRYADVARKHGAPHSGTGKRACGDMLEQVLQEAGESVQTQRGQPAFVVGKTKALIGDGAHRWLENERMAILVAQALVVQKVWRGYIARRNYFAQRRGALKAQAVWRGVLGRRAAAERREEVRRAEEERRRREEEERRRREEEEERRRRKEEEERVRREAEAAAEFERLERERAAAEAASAEAERQRQAEEEKAAAEAAAAAAAVVTDTDDEIARLLQEAERTEEERLRLRSSTAAPNNILVEPLGGDDDDDDDDLVPQPPPPVTTPPISQRASDWEMPAAQPRTRLVPQRDVVVAVVVPNMHLRQKRKDATAKEMMSDPERYHVQHSGVVRCMFTPTGTLERKPRLKKVVLLLCRHTVMMFTSKRDSKPRESVRLTSEQGWRIIRTRLPTVKDSTFAIVQPNGATWHIATPDKEKTKQWVAALRAALPLNRVQDREYTEIGTFVFNTAETDGDFATSVVRQKLSTATVPCGVLRGTPWSKALTPAPSVKPWSLFGAGGLAFDKGVFSCLGEALISVESEHERAKEVRGGPSSSGPVRSWHERGARLDGILLWRPMDHVATIRRHVPADTVDLVRQSNEIAARASGGVGDGLLTVVVGSESAHDAIERLQRDQEVLGGGTLPPEEVERALARKGRPAGGSRVDLRTGEPKSPRRKPTQLNLTSVAASRSDLQAALGADGGRPRPQSSKASTSIFGKMRSKKLSTVAKGVFGRPLADAVPRGHVLPVVVEHALFALNCEEALCAEGIFRISGSHGTIQTWKQRYDASDESAHLIDEPDSHAVAGVLKLYLRELPESLLTPELFDSFVAAGSMPERADMVAAFGRLVAQLPSANAALLKELVRMFAKVVARSHVNKMGAQNLATIFSVAFTGPLASASDEYSLAQAMYTMSEAKGVQELICSLIACADDLFPAYDAEPTRPGGNVTLARSRAASRLPANEFQPRRSALQPADPPTLKGRAPTIPPEPDFDFVANNFAPVVGSSDYTETYLGADAEYAAHGLYVFGDDDDDMDGPPPPLPPSDIPEELLIVEDVFSASSWGAPPQAAASTPSFERASSRRSRRTSSESVNRRARQSKMAAGSLSAERRSRHANDSNAASRRASYMSSANSRGKIQYSKLPTDPGIKGSERYSPRQHFGELQLSANELVRESMQGGSERAGSGARRSVRERRDSRTARTRNPSQQQQESTPPKEKKSRGFFGFGKKRSTKKVSRIKSSARFESNPDGDGSDVCGAHALSGSKSIIFWSASGYELTLTERSVGHVFKCDTVSMKFPARVVADVSFSTLSESVVVAVVTADDTLHLFALPRQQQKDGDSDAGLFAALDGSLEKAKHVEVSNISGGLSPGHLYNARDGDVALLACEGGRLLCARLGVTGSGEAATPKLEAKFALTSATGMSAWLMPASGDGGAADSSSGVAVLAATVVGRSDPSGSDQYAFVVTANWQLAVYSIELRACLCRYDVPRPEALDKGDVELDECTVLLAVAEHARVAEGDDARPFTVAVALRLPDNAVECAVLSCERTFGQGALSRVPAVAVALGMAVHAAHVELVCWRRSAASHLPTAALALGDKQLWMVLSNGTESRLLEYAVTSDDAQKASGGGGGGGGSDGGASTSADGRSAPRVVGRWERTRRRLRSVSVIAPRAGDDAGESAATLLPAEARGPAPAVYVLDRKSVKERLRHQALLQPHADEMAASPPSATATSHQSGGTDDDGDGSMATAVLAALAHAYMQYIGWMHTSTPAARVAKAKRAVYRTTYAVNAYVHADALALYRHLLAATGDTAAALSVAERFALCTDMAWAYRWAAQRGVDALSSLRAIDDRLWAITECCYRVGDTAADTSAFIAYALTLCDTVAKEELLGCKDDAVERLSDDAKLVCLLRAVLLHQRGRLRTYEALLALGDGDDGGGDRSLVRSSIYDAHDFAKFRSLSAGAIAERQAADACVEGVTEVLRRHGSEVSGADLLHVLCALPETVAPARYEHLLPRPGADVAQPSVMKWV